MSDHLDATDLGGEASLSENNDDLIVARATAGGPAALAVIRLDGRGAAELARAMFHPRFGKTLANQPRRMVFGQWRDPTSGDILDEGLSVFFPGPRSYTGNDLVEFHCHGGPIPARRLTEAALALGARIAEPGEFTRRAFMNGRMDLAQAEAVADIINAQTEAAARMAHAQLAGALSERIGGVREGLINLAAEIEARIDFPEEDLEDYERERLEKAFSDTATEIDALLLTRQRGRLLREGARIALVGRPNAGKSSLLNALAHRERAIVTPHPGTTRDTVECTIDLHGIPLTLIDTAGLRDSDDPVERIGIERARREIEQADLVVLVRDITQVQPGAVPSDPALQVRRPDLTVYNKIDLAKAGAKISTADAPDTFAVSATLGDGLAGLEEEIARRLMGEGGQAAGMAMAINLRHGSLLERAQGSLTQARQAFADGISGEFVMVDLREALDALSEIIGLEIGDAILDRVFTQFCLGK